MPIHAGSRLGPYEVLSPLGAGGMGEVWRARDTRLSREVAVKVLPAEVSSDRERLSRFEKEARAASSLNHPNIVTLFEIGKEGAVSYIAMELVSGKTLRELVEGGPLPVRRVLAIGAQVADGLAKAHAAGIVHRDLKPENIMVSEDGFAKILDFGLAKLTQPEPEAGKETAAPTISAGTEPGVVMGTVGYMSPEQASGQPLDYRSDQFSLGAVLYEMAAGKRAFTGKTKPEVLAAIIRDEPEPIGSVNPKVPPPLRWILERCLAKERRERYASTEDLARDLATVRDRLSEASISGAALAAAPSRKILRPIAAAALLVLALAAGIAIEKVRSSPASAPSFRRITFRSGGLGMARFAPDGETIIYSATWGPTRDVFMMRMGDPESRLLYSETDLFAVSDRGELAIMPGGYKRQPTLLSRVPLAGGAPREVAEDVEWANADWAPGGQDLVIIRSAAGKNRLEYPIGRVLYETDAVICCPRFAPDGRTIAFFEANSSVRTLRTDATVPAVLSSGWGTLAGVPCWVRGGREIWFTASHPGESDALYRVDLSGRLREVARVPGQLELYDVSAGGRVLVGHHTLMVNLKWGRTMGGEAERDLSWLDRSVAVDLSADGRSVLFTEVGEGGGANSAIYLRPTDGSAAKRLGEGEALALSPDGRWVLATSHARLFLVPTGAGQAKALSASSFEEIAGADWSPDGTRIVFSAREKGKGKRLYVRPVDGGQERAISPEGVELRGFGDSISPDGRVVVGLPAVEQFTQFPEKRGQPRLYRLDGAEARPIPGLQEGELPLQWTAEGDALYVYRRGRLPAEVRLLDVVTGQRRDWKRIGPAAGSAVRLLISRDGSSYAYSSFMVLSELELAEGLK